MARRICTIVIDPALQQIRLGELRGFLQLQKYPPKLIDDGIEKAKGLSLSQLRTPRKKVERNIIPFVNTHDPGVTNIFTTMKANLPILLQSPKMRDLTFIMLPFVMLTFIMLIVWHPSKGHGTILQR